MDPEDRYWALDLPGLDEAVADALLEHARALPGILGPSKLDPKKFLTLSMDVYTVRTLVDGLHPDGEAATLVEEFEAWLAYADPPEED